MALYYQDETTGDHVVTHNAEVLRFSSRSEALKAVHELVDNSNAMRQHPSQR